MSPVPLGMASPQLFGVQINELSKSSYCPEWMSAMLFVTIVHSYPAFRSHHRPHRYTGCHRRLYSSWTDEGNGTLSDLFPVNTSCSIQRNLGKDSYIRYLLDAMLSDVFDQMSVIMIELLPHSLIWGELWERPLSFGTKYVSVSVGCMFCISAFWPRWLGRFVSIWFKRWVLQRVFLTIARRPNVVS
jgi:hypothetical protein